MDMIQVWDKQNGETDKAYLAFSIFLQCSNLKQVSEKTGKSLSQIKRYSSKFNWEFRKNEWLRDLANQNIKAQREAHIAELTEYKQAQLIHSKELRNACVTFLLKLHTRIMEFNSQDMAAIRAVDMGHLIKSLSVAFDTANSNIASGLGVEELLQVAAINAIDMNLFD